MRVTVIRGALVAVIFCTGLLQGIEFAHAQQSAAANEFDALMSQVSNWGRWGAEDELGTLNLITPAKRKAAARLVQEGISISLSLELNKIKDDLNTDPFEHQLTRTAIGSQQIAGDHYAIVYHGAAHSHIDGLAHVLHDGKLYNGFESTELRPEGAARLGIENAAAGIFTRGILVDMTWLMGVDYLEPGTVITVADLESWEARTGLRVESGDVLLLRTGRWEYGRQTGSEMISSVPGFHASVALWLSERDVAVIGSDAISDVIPSGVEGKTIPLHELALAGMGMPMLDNLDLDAVAAYSGKIGRWEFLFIGAPLRVPGGTGAPLNPLAVF